MNPVKQLTANDCGIAVLATLAGGGYMLAYDALFPTRRAANDCSSLRTSESKMRRAFRKLGYKVSKKHGTPDFVGDRGLISVKLDLDFGSDGHWLAWERNPATGVVSIWNPHGDMFEYKPGALYNRGMRITWWVSITRSQSHNKGR